MLDLVKDGGRLATITSDPPDSTRGVEVHEVYVSPDGARLERLTALLAAGNSTSPWARGTLSRRRQRPSPWCDEVPGVTRSCWQFEGHEGRGRADWLTLGFTQGDLCTGITP